MIILQLLIFRISWVEQNKNKDLNYRIIESRIDNPLVDFFTNESVAPAFLYLFNFNDKGYGNNMLQNFYEKSIAALNNITHATNLAITFPRIRFQDKIIAGNSFHLKVALEEYFTTKKTRAYEKALMANAIKSISDWSIQVKHNLEDSNRFLQCMQKSISASKFNTDVFKFVHYAILRSTINILGKVE